MTDLVFLLLIFFLLTSTLINPNALRLLLPKSTGQITEKAPVRVFIQDNHQKDKYTFYLCDEKTPVPFSKLEDGIVSLLQGEEDPTFSIFADETVPVGKIVDVMNIAKRNHYKVILATDAE